MDKNRLDDTGKNVMSFLVRLLGLFLLLVGLWVALWVLLTAQSLYQHPEQIEIFAAAIEKGSNIDKTMASLRENLVVENELDNGVQNYTETDRRPSSTGSGNIRISYFFTWIIVMLLLLLVARIALATIKTGGELVLFDMQIKHLARMLAKESHKIRD